jgi:hypothetical protein
LDPTPAEPGEQYEESDALAAPLGAASNNVPFVAQPDSGFESQAQAQYNEELPAYNSNFRQ